jgi:hypothetical protein
MIGARSLRGGLRCGTQTGCWRWGCESSLSSFSPSVGRSSQLYFPRFSVPYHPPHKEYIPLEAVVKMVPNYAYQLYFANPESTKEIEANVWNVIFECASHPLIPHSSIDSCGGYINSRPIRKISHLMGICERLWSTQDLQGHQSRGLY